MTNQEIKNVGQTIAQETQIGGNTAARVGGVVEGIGVALDNKDAANGYYQATISGGTITVNAPNYLLGTGGNLRIKMPSAGTTASTLTIGNANAVQLWYNGAAVSSQNTWEQDEIISVFYDGTRFMASNAQGGGGKAKKIKYDNSQSGLAAENMQEALDEINGSIGDVDKCRQNSIRNILAVPRKVEFEHAGGGTSSIFNIYKFFHVEKNKKYTVTLKTLNSLDLGSSKLTLGFSNSNEAAFTNVDLAIERSFILTPTSYSDNVNMYVWCNRNTRNTRFHVTISWTDYIDNIYSGFELLMEEYNKGNAKYVTEEKIIRGLASPRGVYINALTDDANFGKVCTTNGADYRTTDYIPCKGVAKINASLFLAKNGWGYGLAFYDENKVPIRTSAEYWNYSSTGTYNRWLIDVPKNACYFRNSQWKQDPFPFTFYYDTFSSESIQNSLEAVQENVNAIKDEVFDIPESVPASSRYSYYGEKLTFKEHQFTSEQYMSLSLSGIGQGAANYGKYYIVGNTNGVKFDVFDLETKTKLGVITVPAPSISNTHSNTIAFSNKFYEAGDEFPIMYNCSGYGTGSNPTTFAVYGYRIINNNGEFTATLVHTITLTGTGGWTEFVIDNENNTAWIKLESPTLGFVWYKTPMPSVSNGDVTIDLDSLTPEFKVPSYLGSAQGHLFYKGKIYYTSDAIDGTSTHYLYVLDVSSGRFSAIINTNNVYYNAETENVFVYNEHLFIGYRGRVYKLYFD